MFLKKDNSITAKLTTLYVFSSIILLSLVCLFSYLALSDIVFHGNETFLTDEMNVIKQAMLAHPNDEKILQQHVIEIPKVLDGSVYRFLVRISDANNHEIMSTLGSNQVFTVVKSNQKLSWIQSKSNEKFLVMQEFIRLPNAQNRLIQIALNVTYQSQLIRDYRDQEYLKKILGILAIGSLISLFLGYVVARRGLKQLFLLAKASQNITSNSLSQRLAVNNLPKELITVSQSFNQMLDRIEQGYEKLSQFSANLAHELRTPINNLMLQNEIAVSKGTSVIEYQKVLESNLEEMQRLAQIIENILFLARSSNSLDELPKEHLDLRQEITKIIDFFQIMADEKSIKITCEGEGFLLANLVMFRRMISNLLSNAVNYSEPYGSIHCKIENINQSTLEISIIDKGIGIASEHLSKLGNRFYRAQQGTEGVGLGLAIVKSIVEIHQGSFAIFSELNKGTRVVLTFPCLSF